MAMASLTSGLLVRKGHAKPSSFKPSSTPFRFENDDAVELLEETHRLAAQNQTPKRAEEKANIVSAPVEVVKQETKKAIKRKPQPTFKKLTTKAGATNSDDVARKTIRIRKDLNTTLRVLAARSGMSQKQIVESALATYLEKQRSELDCICGVDDL